MEKKSIISIGMACVMTCGLLIGCGDQKTTVSLNDYITIESEGYDGYGSVSYTFDESAFIDDFFDEIKYKSDSNNDNSSVPAAQSLASYITDSGLFTIEDNLSNGEDIVFTWNIDTNAINDLYAVKLEYSDIPYTVESLEPLTSVDIFRDVSMNFSGVSPNANAYITVNSDILSSDDFSLDKYNAVANGDIILVSIDESAVNRIASTYGIIPTVTWEEYYVDRLNFLAYSYNLISGEQIDYLRDLCLQDVQTILNADNNLPKYKNIIYAGDYFFTISKDEDNGIEGKNRLYIFYNVLFDAQDLENMYIVAELDNVTLDSDLNVVLDLDTSVFGEQNLRNNNSYDLLSGADFTRHFNYTWEDANSWMNDQIDDSFELSGANVRLNGISAN